MDLPKRMGRGQNSTLLQDYHIHSDSMNDDSSEKENELQKNKRTNAPSAPKKQRVNLPSTPGLISQQLRVMEDLTNSTGNEVSKRKKISSDFY